MQRIRLARRPEHAQRLFETAPIGHGALEHRHGHAAVEKRVVRLVVGNLAPADELVDDERREVHAAEAHVVGVAPAPRVDLEEPEGSVAKVVLDVEVGEASVSDAREKAARAFDDFAVALAHNGERIAERRRIVVLQAHDAARHDAQRARCVREGRERADGGIVAGDEVLQHKLAVVVAALDVRPGTGKLCGRFDLVDLALARDRRALKHRRVRRLRNERVRVVVHGKLVGAARAAVEVPRLRIRNG